MENSKSLGLFAENIASKYLEKAGYFVLQYNYEKPWGEVDIIAKKDDVLIFVEVKSGIHGCNPDFAPELRVDYKKIRTIVRVAESYISGRSQYANSPWQIDVIGVALDKDNKKAHITHYKNVASDLN